MDEYFSEKDTNTFSSIFINRGKNLLKNYRKYPLLRYILGVLTHTTTGNYTGEVMKHTQKRDFTIE